jgi:O-antigen/teichoic acid export membrane protein
VQAVVYLIAVSALAPTIGLIGALAAIAVAHAAAAGALWLGSKQLRVGPSERRHSVNRSHLVGAISFGAKPYLANVLQMINFRVDLFLLAVYTSHIEVGYYAVATALTLPLAIIPGSLGTVLFPRVASLSGEDGPSDGRLGEVEDRALRHASVLILGAAAVLAAILLFLVPVIFGSRFGPVTEPGLILLPGAGALALFNVFGATVSGRGRPQDVLRTMLLTTPATSGLYLLLIPAYGIDGAAVASTLSYASSAAVLGFLLRRADPRGLSARLIPRRSELADYRSLVLRVRALARKRK